MYSNFKEQGIEFAKQAVAEDNAGNYAEAFSLYMKALDYFEVHLKYEKNPKIKEMIRTKLNEYLARAEILKEVVQGAAQGGPPGDASVAVRSKAGAKASGKGASSGGADDDSEAAKLRSGLNSAIVREKPNVKWSDVAGLEGAKQSLQEAVILPVKFPQFFTGKRRPWRAFLLYGPPGTGKSYLAKAVATESDSTFFSISSSDLVSKWMGESEKLVSNLFFMARESAPSIIFIDEIDSLCGQRGEGNESEASRRIKTELLVQMQGMGKEDTKVLVLAATNTPYSLDQAVRRRFDKRIYIPLPDVKAREVMFKVHLGDTPHSLTPSDFEDLAKKTDGFSGSDVAVCVKDVLFEPVRKTQDAMHFKVVRRKKERKEVKGGGDGETAGEANKNGAQSANGGAINGVANGNSSNGAAGINSSNNNNKNNNNVGSKNNKDKNMEEWEDVFVPCGPREEGAKETTMEELDRMGLASKILPPPISRSDFDKVLARQKPTVSKSDLEVHERFTKEFGEEG